jgi:hypothetical protein
MVNRHHCISTPSLTADAAREDFAARRPGAFLHLLMKDESAAA